LLLLKGVGPDPRSCERRCAVDALTTLIAPLVVAACSACTAASVVSTLLSLALSFANVFNALEFVVAVASFRAGLATRSAASVVSALFSVAARLTALLGKDVGAGGADIVAAVTQKKTEIVALAVSARGELTALAGTAAALDACAFRTR
jgi:hypothetical protein